MAVGPGPMALTQTPSPAGPSHVPSSLVDSSCSFSSPPPRSASQRWPPAVAPPPHIGPIRVRERPKVPKIGIARGQFWQCGQIAKCPIRRKTLHMLVTEHVCTRNRSMNAGLPSAFETLCFTLQNSSALRSTGLFLSMSIPKFSICEGGV